LNEKFFCGNGSIILASQKINDHKPFGTLSFEDILIYSSNVGIIKVGQRLGVDTFSRTLRFYGFGSKTGVELPGENQGILRDPKDWSGVSIGSISFGHELSVNGLQMSSFVSAIANDGYFVKPRILAGVEKPEEELPINPDVDKKIMSKHTAKTLTGIMEKVVIRGTGKKAWLEEYIVAGKTGTAQKTLESGGGYEQDKFISSFIGFAPVDDPRFVMYIVFDEPKGLSDGGDVAAPVFKNVALNVLRYMKVPSREDIHFFYEYPWDEGRKNNEFFLANFQPSNERNLGFEVTYENGQIGSVAENENPDIIMPDFKGRSYRQVWEVLVDMNLSPKLKGTGIAYDQYPPAGSLIKPQSSCVVLFRNGSGS
jgi:membrane peptidoglycan carboxypeptidase